MILKAKWWPSLYWHGWPVKVAGESEAVTYHQVGGHWSQVFFIVLHLGKGLVFDYTITTSWLCCFFGGGVVLLPLSLETLIQFLLTHSCWADGHLVSNRVQKVTQYSPGYISKTTTNHYSSATFLESSLYAKYFPSFIFVVCFCLFEDCSMSCVVLYDAKLANDL